MRTAKSRSHFCLPPAVRVRRKPYLLPLCSAEDIVKQACLQGRILSYGGAETRFKVPPLTAAPFPGQSFAGLSGTAAYHKLLVWTHHQTRLENEECLLRLRKLWRENLLDSINMTHSSQERWKSGLANGEQRGTLPEPSCPPPPQAVYRAERKDKRDVCTFCDYKSKEEKGHGGPSSTTPPTQLSGPCL